MASAFRLSDNMDYDIESLCTIIPTNTNTYTIEQPPYNVSVTSLPHTKIKIDQPSIHSISSTPSTSSLTFPKKSRRISGNTHIIILYQL